MSCVPPICPIRAGLVRDFDAAFHTIEPHGHSMREGVSRCLTAIFRIIVPEYAQSLYDGGRCESLEPISADGGPARNAKIAGDSECSFYSFGNAHFLRWRRKFNVAANRKATGHHSPWAGYIRFLPVLEVCAMQGVGRSVRGADKRDHRGEKFDVLACHFQFWDKAKCFTEWPHQSTRGKVAPSIILRCYELACLPRVTQGLEPPLLGQRRLWPMFIRIGKHLPDFFCRLTERPACFHHDKLHAIARPAFVAVVCSAPILVVEAESVLTSAGWARSEEHTSELQSLMRISYAVFCLKKNKILKCK